MALIGNNPDLYVSRSLSRRFCCYTGCKSDVKKTRDGAITFFSFPVKDTERCSVWITNSGREEFRYLTPSELSDKRICELHFEDSVFSNFFKTGLKKNAVPINCKKYIPELIIRIDDDDDSNDERESGIASENSSINNNSELINSSLNHNSVIEDDVNGLPLEYSNNVNSGLQSGGGVILPTILNNEQNLPSVECSAIERELTSIVKNTRNQPKNKMNRSKKILKQKSSMKPNTKFHNLPPQTTHNDFYFQACSESAEETNNSIPEPLEGELPLYVQHDSAVSLADEPANSEVSEPLTKRRKRDQDDEDLGEQMRDAVKHLKNITSLLSSNEDEFDLFGKIVALQLKKMSLCTALEVQAKIQNLLSQHRISDIQKELNKNKVLSKSFENQKAEKEDKDHRNEKIISKNAEEEEQKTPASPQLSVTCASENSDNEIPENS